MLSEAGGDGEFWSSPISGAPAGAKTRGRAPRSRERGARRTAANVVCRPIRRSQFWNGTRQGARRRRSRRRPRRSSHEQHRVKAKRPVPPVMKRRERVGWLAGGSACPVGGKAGGPRHGRPGYRRCRRPSARGEIVVTDRGGAVVASLQPGQPSQTEQTEEAAVVEAPGVVVVDGVVRPE